MIMGYPHDLALGGASVNDNLPGITFLREYIQDLGKHLHSCTDRDSNHDDVRPPDTVLERDKLIAKAYPQGRLSVDRL